MRVASARLHAMNPIPPYRYRAALVAATLFATMPALAQSPGMRTETHSVNQTVSHTAKGSFEVKLTPQTPEEAVADPMLARLLIAKQFHGDLEAVSKGQMLSAGTAEKGSAGYVAIEKVSGTLDGKSGSFVLQHTGTMNRGEPELSVSVVPDSGTDELSGISGKMSIDISDGAHRYTFDYKLPRAAKP
jgi:hypothetical protein